MKHKMELNSFIGFALIGMYGKCGDLVSAEGSLMECRGRMWSLGMPWSLGKQVLFCAIVFVSSSCKCHSIRSFLVVLD